MNQAGFVVQDVPYFDMLISGCGDQTPFNLTTELQTWKNIILLSPLIVLLGTKTMIHKNICFEVEGCFRCVALEMK